MNVAVVGSRDFEDYAKFAKEIDNLPIKVDRFISGGCPTGADKFIENYCDEHEIPMIIHNPDWKKYGRAAGPIRNKKIVEDADYLVAFWDGKSPGTKSSIEFARKKGITVLIISI